MAGASAPKILLAKPPGLGSAGSSLSREDESSAASSTRPRVPSLASLNLLVFESWEINADRALPFLTENTDFTVVGVIGLPGAGKSTIMNELYGYDGASAGNLPPFSVQSDETRLTARHCTVGIEIRISPERMILLDAQPTFSSSLLSDMTRPDGSSSIPVMNSENQNLLADLAHELMDIQVDMLKHNIPDPSMISSEHVQVIKSGKEGMRYDVLAPRNVFLAIPIFVHTKLNQQDIIPRNETLKKNVLHEYFQSSSYSRDSTSELGSYLALLPRKAEEDGQPQLTSFSCALEKLRNQVLSMNTLSFSKPINERDWLRNSARIWEMVKRSPVIADYYKLLQNSGQFRK